LTNLLVDAKTSICLHAQASLAATGEKPEEPPDNRNPHAVALGKLGGQKGGKARARKLTPEQRREMARKAAEARWKKQVI
jgi:hypothetical protein